jgi:hypothetical protein
MCEACAYRATHGYGFPAVDPCPHRLDPWHGSR